MKDTLKQLYIFECSITYAFSKEDYTHSSEIIAETASKARYKFYKQLEPEEDYSEYLRYIKVRKRGVYDNRYLPTVSLEDELLFQRVINTRNIPFAKIGMKIEVNGKMGKIVGANSSNNLNVVFHTNGNFENCHPHWETTYYDEDNTVIKSFCKNLMEV